MTDLSIPDGGTAGRIPVHETSAPSVTPGTCAVPGRDLLGGLELGRLPGALVSAHRDHLEDDGRSDRVHDEGKDVRPDDERPRRGEGGPEDAREGRGECSTDAVDEGSESDVGGSGRMEDEVEAEEEEDDARGQRDDAAGQGSPTTTGWSSDGPRPR